MFELVYTSVPQGLLPGTRGFSTAAFTAGMPPNLIMPLENLSGYNFVFQNGTLLSELNPPCCCYIKMRFGNQTLPVASRIAPNGLDYSQRNNKIAHHWLFESPDEVAQTLCGAAGLLGNSQYFMHNFTGEPRELPFRRVPVGKAAKLPAVCFQELAGDCGWAGVIAQRFRTNPGQAFYIKYPRHTDPDKLLDLVCEVSALLNKDELANFTFSTYFIQQGSSTDCFLRMLPDFSPLLITVERFHADSLLVLDGNQTLPAEYADLLLCHTARYGLTQAPEPEAVAILPPEESSIDNDIIRLPLPPQRLKPVPGSKPVISASQAITDTVIKTQAEQPSANKKLIIAAGVILFLSAVISLLLVLSSPESSPMNSPVTAPAEKFPAKLVNPPNEQQSAPAAAKVKTEEKPAAKIQPPKKSEPALQPKSLMDAEVRKQAIAIDNSTGLRFFAAFSQASSNHDRQYIMPLPEKLHNPDEIYVEMRIPGKPAILPNNHSFIRPGKDGGVTVIEAQKGIVPHIPVKLGAIAPELFITPANDGKALLFITSGKDQPIIPEKRNIGRFYFRIKHQVFSVDCNFHSVYLHHLPPGKLYLSANGIFSYQPTQLEEMLDNFIETRIGQSSKLTLCSQKLPFEEWNNAVPKFCSTHQEYLKIRKKISVIQKNSSQPASKKEVEEFTRSIKVNSYYADMELLCGKVSSILNSFFTDELLNRRTASDKEIKEMISAIEKILNGYTREIKDKKRQAKLKNQAADWKKQHKQIQELRSLLQQQQQYINTLKSQNHKLNAIYGRILNPVKSANPAAGNRLHTMLINQNDQLPRTIGNKEIAELTNLLQQQIKFLPLQAN